MKHKDAIRAVGKLEELTHEMGRYRWNILGLWACRAHYNAVRAKGELRPLKWLRHYKRGGSYNRRARTTSMAKTL